MSIHDIRTARLPGDGPSPWADGSGEDGYDASCNSLAKAYWILLEERPELAEGSTVEVANRLWDEVKKRWPGASEWLRVSGNQVEMVTSYVLSITVDLDPPLRLAGD